MATAADLAASAAAELAPLIPYLPAALVRDTAGGGGLPAAWAGITVVNADVLAAILRLEADVPAAVRAASYAAGERYQRRKIGGHLRQVPRLAARLRDLRLLSEEQALAWHAAGWLRMTKRALGLRRPDLPIGYACPHELTDPAGHEGGRWLLAAGDEGYLRDGPAGPWVEWARTPRIWCEGCAASWGLDQWPHLGRLLRDQAAVPVP